jgi:hypothetical protein
LAFNADGTEELPQRRSTLPSVLTPIYPQSPYRLPGSNREFAHGIYWVEDEKGYEAVKV